MALDYPPSRAPLTPASSGEGPQRTWSDCRRRTDDNGTVCRRRYRARSPQRRPVVCCRSGKICPDTSVRLCVPCHMRVVRQTGATVVVDRPKSQTTADRRPPIVRIAWVAAGQGACRCETPAAGGANKPSPLRLVGWRAALHGGSPRGRARAYAIGRRALPTCEGHRGAGLSAKLRPTGDPSRLLHLLSMGPQIAEVNR